ncbi:MAG: hypothetical protein JXR49_12370 [Acidobacteria bacterium]|nr:hypothetical protein [Acidobacteriota bacterium]
MPSRRITVRLNENLHDHIKRHCDDTGCDVTAVVRKALGSFFSKDEESRQNEGDEIITVPPEEIYDRVGNYLAWGRGDLRAEFKRQFVEILATAFATQRHFPKTPGVKEAYAGLLQISSHFKFN